MTRKKFTKAAKSIGPFNKELGGFPVRDTSRKIIGSADNMPNTDEQFDELVASAKILCDVAV